mgnify:CR=1 FL=1
MTGAPEHAAEVLEFLQDKFTNRDLYGWMVSQLSRTYNQVYKLAYEAARTAERTYLALVWGVPNPVQGSVVGAIGGEVPVGQQRAGELVGVDGVLRAAQGFDVEPGGHASDPTGPLSP